MGTYPIIYPICSEAKRGAYSTPLEALRGSSQWLRTLVKTINMWWKCGEKNQEKPSWNWSYKATKQSIFICNVGETMPCLPAPMTHHFLLGGICLPFPVMGGKNGNLFHQGSRPLLALNARGRHVGCHDSGWTRQQKIHNLKPTVLGGSDLTRKMDTIIYIYVIIYNIWILHKIYRKIIIIYCT